MDVSSIKILTLVVFFTSWIQGVKQPTCAHQSSLHPYYQIPLLLEPVKPASQTGVTEVDGIWHLHLSCFFRPLPTFLRQYAFSL